MATVSLILAAPCRDAVVLASDARVVLRSNEHESVVDGASKIEAAGDFAFAISGYANVVPAARRFWRDAAYKVTAETFTAFSVTMSTAAKRASGQMKTAWLVASVGNNGRSFIGSGNVNQDGSDLTFGTYPFEIDSPTMLRLIGGHPEQMVAYLVSECRQRPTVADWDAPHAAAVLTRAVLMAAAEDDRIGGSPGLVVLRPTIAPCYEDITA